MARKTDAQLAQSLRELQSLREDPERREIAQRVEKMILQRWEQRVDKWFEHIDAIIEGEGSKEDGPRVNLLLGMMHKVISDRREYVQAPAAQRLPQAINISIGVGGEQIRRGTKESRQAAIDVTATRRAQLTDGRDQDLHAKPDRD